MPKGRNFAPCTDKDGIWFRHRGLGAYSWPPQRDPDTSTGYMLTGPFKEFSKRYPPNPPRPYDEKHPEKHFKNSNLFSTHDSRNDIQDFGEYFGEGPGSRTLGRKLKSADHVDIHSTNPDEFYERMSSNLEYRSIYNSSYPRKELHERMKHPRFPRVYPEASTDATLSTKTTTWFRAPDVPFRTPLQTLATSHEPFLKPNKWKYSYHGLSKVYPPYDIEPPRKPKAMETWLLMDQKPKPPAPTVDQKRVISVN